MPAANAFETTARNAKVADLITALRLSHDGSDEDLSTVAADLTDDGWKILTALGNRLREEAGIKERMGLPSETTREEIVAALRRSEAMVVAAECTPDPDPFAGLDDRAYWRARDGDIRPPKNAQHAQGLLSSGDPVTVPYDGDIVDAEVVRLFDGGARVECAIPLPGRRLLRTYPARMVERAPVSTVPRTAPEVPTKEGPDA